MSRQPAGMRLWKQPVRALATVGGSALGALFYLVAAARRGQRKALHPSGVVVPGVLERRGCAFWTGVPWLDRPGTDQVTVRLSRAMGLPDALPDIHGLALRIALPDADHADVLLATTGAGAVTRFLLRPTRRDRSAYTCLLPYRSPSGSLLLAARPVAADGSRWELACAPLTGAWSSFADLHVRPAPEEGADAPVTFDPVLHPVPALENYRWVAQLRRFAYAGSRRARGAAANGPGDHPPVQVPAAVGRSHVATEAGR